VTRGAVALDISLPPAGADDVAGVCSTLVDVDQPTLTNAASFYRGAVSQFYFCSVLLTGFFVGWTPSVRFSVVF